MATYDDGQSSFLEVLRQSLRSSRPLAIADDGLIITSDGVGHGLPNDPDKLRYLRELITYLLRGRAIVATYNIVLFTVLIIFSLSHLYVKSRDCKKILAIERGHATTLPASRGGPQIDDGSVASSSSNSTTGSFSASEDALKVDDVDVERQPLLNRHSRTHYDITRRRQRIGPLNLLRSWLTYQPPPLPLINRTLPSNGTTISVLGFYGLNILYLFHALPLETRHLFALADRAGLLFIANIPPLYLLAAKNQPLKALTGYSYESLNIFHRRVGELMCLAAAVHFTAIVVWAGWLAPDFIQHQLRPSWYHFFTHPVILYGVIAFIAYETLYFTSLGSFRQRWYEIFLASHVVLQVAALVFLWLHFSTARPYVYAALVIFFVDRLVYRLWLKSATFIADLSILEDGETVSLSADWDIPLPRRRRWCSSVLTSRKQNITHGWHPADHIFVTIPALGRVHAMQAHPFTIASAAPTLAASSSDPTSLPDADPPSPSPSPPHAWLNLLIRAQSGFTSALLNHARANNRVSVRVDGPYGSHDPLRVLRACDVAVLIAGGSGIAVAFPLVWELATAFMARNGGEAGQGRREVFLYWVVHSRAQRSWIPQERLDELARWGVHVVIPEPTVEVGRPDVEGYVARLADRTCGEGEVGVMVSGPDGLNRVVRNTCARAIRGGAKVRLQVEKFGW